MLRAQILFKRFGGLTFMAGVEHEDNEFIVFYVLDLYVRALDKFFEPSAR